MNRFLIGVVCAVGVALTAVPDARADTGHATDPAEKSGKSMIEVATHLCHHQAMGRSVLIVDDHAGFRRFAGRLLESAGFTVIGEAEDGAAAIDQARRLRPDLVLLDVLLPDTDGFAVAHELAGDPSGPLVVLVSSRSAGELGHALERSRALGFIAKSDLSATTLTELAGDPS